MLIGASAGRVAEASVAGPQPCTVVTVYYPLDRGLNPGQFERTGTAGGPMCADEHQSDDAESQCTCCAPHFVISFLRSGPHLARAPGKQQYRCQRRLERRNKISPAIGA